MSSDSKTPGPDNNGYLKRVLFVGSSGVGKSAIIKLLTGLLRIITSSAATGCTFDYCPYPFDSEWVFVDSIGLNEGDAGRVPSKEAAKKLIKFIKSNTEGFSLVVFVRDKSRINVMDDYNYKLFNELILGGQVPCILAITHCDFDEPMDRWWQENKSVFDGYGWKLKGAVSVCAIDEDDIQKQISAVRPAYAVAKLQSRDILFQAMRSHSLSKPIKIDAGAWYGIFVNAWNSMCKFLGWNGLYIIIKTAITDALLFLKFTKDDMAEIGT